MHLDPTKDNEVLSIMQELDRLPDDDTDQTDEHRRETRLVFLDEIFDLHGVSSLTIPIRELLTLLAKRYPNEAEILLRIREDYYSGDHEDDHLFWVNREITTIPRTDEERAELRLEREAGADYRASRRASAAAEAATWIAECAQEADWHPYEIEARALDEQKAKLRESVSSLDREWDVFLREPETVGQMATPHGGTSRKSLIEKGSEIDKAFGLLSDQYEILKSKRRGE
jgi:hypothetical protein